MAFVIILSVLLLCCLGVGCFLAQPSFGRNPSGERLERIRRSPNYRDGMFRNQMATPVMTDRKSRWQALWEFVFADRKGLRPETVLPILENGQYNEDWRFIHTMPEQLGQVVSDLNARHVVTVHHSKYALSRHLWDAPLKTARRLKEEAEACVFMPIIGEILSLDINQP